MAKLSKLQETLTRELIGLDFVLMVAHRNLSIKFRFQISQSLLKNVQALGVMT
jgi:hypothetical protein